MGYLVKHWKTLLRSFKIDKLTFKLFVTDILFILSLIIIYGVVLYVFWMKNLLSLSSILDFNDGSMLAVSDIDVNGLWNSFLLKVVILIIIGIILYILLISLYSAFSHTFINKKKFTLKLYLNFLSVYSVLTLIYFALIISIFYLSKTYVMLIAVGIIIFTLIYAYALLIFYLVTNDKALTKIFRQGFRSMVRLHDTLPPLIIGFILLFMILVVLGLLFSKLLTLLSIFVLLAFLYMLTWLKRYLHSIIHEL